jgi:ElaB/YqjD/DUF883 family membrane-anchored ribosome-binding protein
VDNLASKVDDILNEINYLSTEINKELKETEDCIEHADNILHKIQPPLDDSIEKVNEAQTKLTT